VSDPIETPVEPYVSRIDRRTALSWLGAAAASIGGVGVAPEQAAATAAGQVPVLQVPVPGGYGTDPNLKHPTIPWPRLFTAAQLQAVALLCDFILPASADAPSARAVGVPDFIDEWISAPYPEQLADRPVILGGLTWLEAEARRRHGADLMGLAAADRADLFRALKSTPSDAGMAAPHAFFRRLRALIIGAYYTTKPGFKDIGYIGNVAMASYPGPSDEVKAVLARELKKLGLQA
jgi:hypothetical protein